jgi:integrase
MANDMANIGHMPRRDYGSGSVYQRADGRWVATIEAGWTPEGTRKRTVVTAKTKAQVQRKLRDKQLEIERGELGASPRETVKGWADKYLEMRLRELAPKGYNATASPIRRWVVPTIGRKRLEQLTPADLRAVADAQRTAGRKPATVEATHRVLMTMLRAAVREGYAIPARVMAAKPPPKAGKSDRLGMTVPEGLACISEASERDDGTRWLVTLVYGMRQGECLGLTWDAIDFNAGEFGEIVIEWQLQALPYVDRKNKRLGFRVPVGYEARHLVDAYHLVRPKSKQGYRVAPLLLPIREALLRWREVAPESPHGLVWPRPDGRPRNDKHDRAAWADLQAAAEVAHPAGRAYHVHECRNFAATMLLEAGVDEHIITALLGHSSIVMSRRYMTVRREPLLEALTRVGERLQLG